MNGAKLGLQAVMRDVNTGAIVARATKNTITSAGIAHAHNAIFRTASNSIPLNGAVMSARTATDVTLAIVADGFPQYGAISSGDRLGVLFTTVPFQPGADYTLGSIDFWSGETKIWTTTGWTVSTSVDPLEAVFASGVYELSWGLFANINITAVLDLPPVTGLDQATSRISFLGGTSGIEERTIEDEVRSGERFLVGRWSGVDARALRDGLIVQLWGPDPDGDLAPAEALVAGEAVLRETVPGVATGGGATMITFLFELPPINESAAFGYRYGVLRVPPGILSLSDLGPRGHTGTLDDPSSTISYQLRNFA